MIEKEKECRSCGRLLSLDHFYRCSVVKDGRKARCKECMSQEQKERLKDPEVRAKRCANSRKWNNSSRGRVYHREYKKAQKYKQTENKRRQNRKNAPKIKARVAVKDAIRYRRLKKKPCAVCGDSNSEAHHIFGYDKENWIKVVWLCRTHHLKAEEYIRNEKRNHRACS